MSNNRYAHIPCWLCGSPWSDDDTHGIGACTLDPPDDWDDEADDPAVEEGFDEPDYHPMWED